MGWDALLPSHTLVQHTSRQQRLVVPILLSNLRADVRFLNVC